MSDPSAFGAQPASQELDIETLQHVPVLARSQVLSERVYRATLQILAQGGLRCGVALPIDVLSKALGVSAPPMREALAHLAATGLPLRPEQRVVNWFWTVTGETAAEAHVAWEVAVERCCDLADHAEAVGGQISFELYEGTYLAPPESALRLLVDIGCDNVGLNPDLGNLIRVQQPIEPWESMAVRTLPFANYWHVKNYARARNRQAGIYLASPVILATGLIDYRRAIAFAVAHGFRGAFLCENYGGDGLSVSAENSRYLTSLFGKIGRIGVEVRQ